MPEASASIFQARIGTFTASAAHLQAQIGTLTASAGELKAQIGTLSASADNLKAQIGTLTASAGDLKAKIGTLSVCAPQFKAAIGSYPPIVKHQTPPNQKYSITLFDKQFTTYNNEVLQPFSTLAAKRIIVLLKITSQIGEGNLNFKIHTDDGSHEWNYEIFGWDISIPQDPLPYTHAWTIGAAGGDFSTSIGQSLQPAIKLDASTYFTGRLLVYGSSK